MSAWRSALVLALVPGSAAAQVSLGVVDYGWSDFNLGTHGYSTHQSYSNFYGGQGLYLFGDLQ